MPNPLNTNTHRVVKINSPDPLLSHTIFFYSYFTWKLLRFVMGNEKNILEFTRRKKTCVLRDEKILLGLLREKKHRFRKKKKSPLFHL